MTLVPGDKIISFQDSGGKLVGVAENTMIVGDKLVLSRSLSGNQNAVRISQSTVGDKIVIVQDSGGKLVAIRGAPFVPPTITIEGKAMVYLGGGVVLASSRNDKILYRSVDYGVHWTAIPFASLAGDIMTAPIWAMCTVSDGVCVAATDGNQEPDTRIHMMRSTDYGLSWTYHQSVPRMVSKVYISPESFQKYGSTIYFCTLGSVSIWSSTNGGQSYSFKKFFHPPAEGYPMNGYLAVCNTNGKLAVAMEGGWVYDEGFFYTSSNSGTTWVLSYKFGSTIYPYSWAVMASCILFDDICVIGMSTSTQYPPVEDTWTTIRRNLNDGVSGLWHYYSIGDSTFPKRFTRFFRVPGGTKVVGFQWDKGLWNSSDNGANWTFRQTIPEPPGLWVDEFSSCCYMADYEGGTLLWNWNGILYKTSDGGNTWVSVTPLPV